MRNTFQYDQEYCPCCASYVKYLASIENSYCIECGSEVRMFSDADWSAFKDKMQARKPKGGRQRKDALRTAAAAARDACPTAPSLSALGT